MVRPVVALLTDFGTRDAYVAAMKGVVLSIAADATVIDLSHEVPPHDVRAGARLLFDCAPYYPAGTVFLAVVDPGVGSSRRAIAAEGGGYRWVGPDNGLFSAVFERYPPEQIVELTARTYQRPTVSRTFEGRDRFAPAAAWIARGTALSALGPAVGDYVRLEWPAAVVTPAGITGEVTAVDRFGNLISNLARADVERCVAEGPIDIAVAGAPVERLVATYDDASPGEPCALFGSTDHLEIALLGASAAAHFLAGAGTPVTVRRRRAL